MADKIGICIGFGGNGWIYNIFTDNNGKILANGAFTSFNGDAISKVIRLNPDGSRDDSYNAGGSGFEINDTLMQSGIIDNDNNLYFGGGFNYYNGSAGFQNFIGLNPDGTLRTNYAWYGAPNRLRKDNSGKIYATAYPDANNVDYNLRILTSGGTLTSFAIYKNPAVDFNTQQGLRSSDEVGSGRYFATPTDVAIDSTGKIYIVGDITHMNNTQIAKGIVKLNTDGTRDSSFQINSGFVYTSGDQKSRINTILVDSNDKLFLGGRFNSYSGTTKYGVIKLHTNGSIDTSFVGKRFYNSETSPLNDAEIYAIALDSNGKLYVGGYFTKYDTVDGRCLVRINADGTRDNAFDVGVGFNQGAWVRTITIDDDGNLLVGGIFTSYKGVAAKGFIKLDVSGNSLVESTCILAPTITGTSTTYNSITLNWVNNETTNIDNNVVQIYSGGTWNDKATLSSGSTSYTITNLSSATTYRVRVSNKYGVDYYASAYEDITTAPYTPIAPSGETYSNVTCSGATLSWVNNNTGGTTGNYIQKYNGSTWVTIATVGTTTTSYNITGLTPLVAYTYRVAVYNGSFTIPSSAVNFTTLDATPFNLNALLIYQQAIFTWSLNDLPYGTAIRPDIRISGDANWTLGSNLPKGTTTHTFTGLNWGVTYEVRIVRIGSEYPSAIYTFTVQSVTYLQPFCDGTHYLVTGSTCGNSTGRIELSDELYTIFYDFTLTDVDGNSTALTGYEYFWSGLTASWYKLTATPKPEYYYVYGAEPCIINWIALEDSDTTLSLTDTKIKPAICGGFGNSSGRIIYNMADSNGSGWTFNLYTEAYELVNTQILTDISAIVYLCRPNIYYGILENNHGCTYLIDLTEVLSERLYTVDGIQKLYLTPWTTAIGYNYYDNTSDDWYQSGLDAQQFTSSKISEYFDLPDFWYEIKLDTARMNYLQSLIKSQNGLIYDEIVEISIPSADNAKWQQLKTLLSQRYVIIFQDSNGYYWTCFYRSGAEVKAYGLSENQYKITFSYPATKQMLTSIDEAYVKLHIL